MSDSIQKRIRLLKNEIIALGGKDIDIDVGKHCKVRFTNPQGLPQILTVSVSPSDRRAAQRVAKDLRRLMSATLMFAFLVVTPALSITLEERTAEDQRWVNLMEKVAVCTAAKEAEFSEATRLKLCLEVEQWLRNRGRCMYSPEVLGIWDGKHCR